VRVTLGRDQRGGVEFVVSDTGVGISSHDLKRVFEPFVQAEDGNARRFGGIGLGLAISRSLARLHDGDVVIASEPGKGTVARLVLPPSRLTSAAAPQTRVRGGVALRQQRVGAPQASQRLRRL
jgi:signal transduction histidine kinase